MKLTAIVAMLLFSAQLHAGMVRIVSVSPAATLVLDNGTEVQLAAIEVTDPVNAVALLRWSIGAWVLVEDGLVYRSPDGLLLNRELVTRGFARATSRATVSAPTVPLTYLGEVSGDRRPRPAAKAKAPVRARPERSDGMPTPRRGRRSITVPLVVRGQ